MGPHPMYRYQENEWSFGGPTWFCHQRCGDYTHWRIVEADIGKVPVEDVPEGWGMRDREIEEVRRIRRAEIRGQRRGQEQGQEAPAQEAPAQEAPAQEAPAQEAQAQEAQAREAPAREAPAARGSLLQTLRTFFI